MIGKQIGSRYEILEMIGGGGMAIVYKAHDILLNRKVAVKILREQYVHDEDFIRRFRREAQSAASLSHPNVVSIYDVGQEEDIHYIVMEYVAGSNLNEEIKRKAPLQVDEALRIALQICDALDHAHQNHIIHRDIKPHNILIGRNGRVKVTDFGIARAATSTDITQTGSVIGSVHYLSPEHAKGIKQGEKSDIYSLGIVLYQMLTNQLPFSGDSPISVALKHLQEQVEPPRKFNPHIPPHIEAIILKTLQKSPEERYGTAKELMQDLEAAFNGEWNDTKIRFENTFTDEDINEQPTRVIPAITEADEEQTRLMPAIGASNRNLTEMDAADPAEETDDANEDEKSGLSPLSKVLIKSAIWLVLIFVFSAGTWYGVQSLKAIFVVPEVPVPDVVNKHLDQAKEMLDEVDLSWELIYDYHEVVEKDHIFNQESDPTLKANSTVTLYVSNGILREKMPNAAEYSLEELKEELKLLGVEDERIVINEVTSEEEPEGTVLEQLPAAGEEFDPRTQIISLTVSQGPELVEMPDIEGEKLSIAKSMLTREGLEADVEEEPSFTVPEGYVTRSFTAEAGDLVPVGSEIKFFVSKGFPDDALEPIEWIHVSPVEDGEPTEIKVEVEDPRGFFEWGTVTITEPAEIPVNVIVTQNQIAVIKYFINDGFVDQHTVTYKDAEDQGASKPKPLEAPFNANENAAVEATVIEMGTSEQMDTEETANPEDPDEQHEDSNESRGDADA